MARKSSTLALNLRGPSSGVPVYRWLYEQNRTAILDRRLPPGARLPATRDLAETYNLSRTTIITAFEQLKSEGYVDGRIGSGTYVSKVLPEQLLEVGSIRQEGRLRHRRIVLSAYARRLQPLRWRPAQPVRAFRPNQAALDLFPTTLWAQVAARRLRRASARLLAGGGTPGCRPPRGAGGGYLKTSPGGECAAAQVVVVFGAPEGVRRNAPLLNDSG